MDGQLHRRPVSRDQGEITVVADRVHGRAHGGVDIPVSEPGGPQRDRDRLREQRADLDGLGAGAVGAGCHCRVERDDLGVGAEPAAGKVDRSQVLLQHAAGGREQTAVGDDQVNACAQRLPAS